MTGTSRDARRLEVAKALGADDVIDVETEDPLERIREITGGRGVDVALDCTSGAGTAPTLLAIEAAKRRAATMVVQSEGDADFASFPMGRISRKGMTLKAARGHSYRSVELALQHLGSGRFPPRPDDDPLLRPNRVGLRHQVRWRGGGPRRYPRVGHAVEVIQPFPQAGGHRTVECPRPRPVEGLGRIIYNGPTRMRLAAPCSALDRAEVLDVVCSR